MENLNKDVDKLIEGGTLERIIAQIDVTFSNSLIESWWAVSQARLVIHQSSRQLGRAEKAG